MTVHSFRKSVARSQSYAGASWWEGVYRSAFPNLAASTYVAKDGWAQRGGIDRVLTLSSGKTLTVDEKVRDKVYPDFALEFRSDAERKVPGWVAKDLACDYIAYAFVPTRTCYLLPFPQLRLAWRRNHEDWVRGYPRIVATNHEDGRTWHTVSVGVPIPIVLRALADAMTVTWPAEAA